MSHHRAGTLRAARRRTGRSLVIGAVLAALVLPIAVTEPATAAVGPNPHTDVVVTKKFDGTGQGTSDATFVNTENGFVPGDDTDTDGVVSSNDIVGYEVSINIKAGLARTIALKMTGTEMLEWKTGQSAFCAPAPGITVEVVGDECRLSIKQGATAHLVRQVQMTAKDTAGLAVEGQKLTVGVSVVGQSPHATAESESVTVVSAPLADLTVYGGRAGTVRHSLYNWSGPGSGEYQIEPRALRPADFSPTKGASAGGEWQATADVSDFPVGTTWQLGDKPVVMNDGKLQLSGLGNLTLSFTMPGEAWPEQPEGTTKWYDLGLAVPATSFISVDYLNNGDGWQPGTGASRDTSTFDATIGSIGGYLYPNNDFTAIRVDRPIPVDGEIFAKGVEVPFTPGQTVFDDSNKFFALATSTARSIPDRLAERAPGTEFRAILGIHSDNLTVGGVAVSGDFWNSGQASAIGAVTVTHGGEALDSSLYTVQWSAEAVNSEALSDPDIHDGWVTTTGPLAGANAVRVIYNDGVVEPNTGTYTVTVPMKVHGDYAESEDPIVRDTHQGRSGETAGAVPGALQIIWPKTPELRIDQVVDHEIRNPGEMLTYTATPQVYEPPTLTNGFEATITVTLDRCLTAPTNQSNIWAMTVADAVPGPSGRVCGDPESTPAVLTFTPATGETIKQRSWDNAARLATLPDVVYTARTTLTSKDSVATGVEFNLSGMGEVTPAFSGSQTSILETSTSAAFIEANQKKVEIEDKMSWDIELVQTITSGTAATVIALPRNDDGAYFDGVVDPSLYPGAKESDFEGTYTLKSVSTNGDHTSSGVELWFTIESSPSLDATTGTWYRVSEAGQGSIPALADATALKVVAEANANGSMALITVELAPVGNAEDDVYLMWVGETAVDGTGMGATQPWPAQTDVVMGKITGTVWWDEDNSAKMQPDEPRIEGVELGLYRIVNGEPASSPMAETVTDTDGNYSFDALKSGQYQVQIIDRGDNLPDSETSYYGEEIAVDTTFSFAGQHFVRSSTKSTIIGLALGETKEDVDFGFFAPDPKVDIDKHPGRVSCAAGVCEAEWGITLTNLGTTDITQGTFTDTMSAEMYDVEALFGEYVPGVAIVEVISQGYSGAFALTDTGDVYSWGIGLGGSNGNGGTSNNLTAQLVQGLPPGAIGEVIYRGYPGGGYALTDGGDVYSWGSGANGANGNGGTSDNLVAQLVQGLPAGEVVEVIARGGYGGYALTSGGDVYSWGRGGNGANGNGGTSDNLVAQLVQGLPVGGEVVEVIARSTDGGYALTSGGDVYSWGRGEYGANGNHSIENNLTAQLVQGLPAGEIAEVIARDYRGGYALTVGGDVYSWGTGTSGSNGNGGGTSYNLTAQLVQGLPVGGEVVEVIARSTDGGYALTSGGDVYSWGRGTNGANGNGGTSNSLTAQLVQGLPTGEVVEVIARTGYSGGYALTTGGDVYSWGLGTNGANGNGGTSDNLTAQLVQGLPAGEIVEVNERDNTAGGYALTAGGDVYSWGLGTNGLNGNGGTSDNLVAQLVQGLPPGEISKVVRGPTDAYNWNVFALTVSGEVYSWGRGSNGINGNGGTSDNLTAQQVQGFPPPVFEPSAAAPAINSTQLDGFTERQYGVPLLPRGESIEILVRGKINQADADQIVANQAWFTSPSTPIAGLLPERQTRPDLPVIPAEPINPDGIPGNPTCNTDADDPDGQSVADSCDQVPVKIPVVPAGSEPGEISGIMWLDVNHDGIKQSDEPAVPGMTVNLFKDGVLYGTMTTGEDGDYLFNSVPPGEGYYTTFALTSVVPTEAQLGLFGLTEGSFGATLDLGRAENQSWMNPETFSTGTVDVASGQHQQWLNGGVVLANAAIQVTKTSAAGDPASLKVDANGDTVEVVVNLGFTNTGSEPLTGFTWTDETIEGPALTGLACLAGGTPVDASTLVLAPTDTVNCTATLPELSLNGEPAHSDRFTVTAVGTITGTPVEGSDEWSAVADGEESWSVSKSSDPVSGTLVSAGDEITYTLEVVNTGDLTLTGAEVFDDMSKVLNNATLVGDLPDGVVRSGTTLVWSVPDVQPGLSADVQYTVKLNDGVTGVVITNTAYGVGDVPPSTCDVDEPCSTEHKTPALIPLPALGGWGLPIYLITGAFLIAVTAGLIANGYTRRKKTA